MGWGKFDDRYPSNRKIRPLSDAAFRLDVSAILWSSGQLTDGHIAADELVLASDVKQPGKAAAELARRGRWHAAGEGCSTDDCPAGSTDGGGWQIHDYFGFNDPKAVVLARREKDNQRKKKPRSDGTPPRNPRGIQTESGRNPTGIRAESEAKSGMDSGPGDEGDATYRRVGDEGDATYRRVGDEGDATYRRVGDEGDATYRRVGDDLPASRRRGGPASVRVNMPGQDVVSTPESERIPSDASRMPAGAQAQARGPAGAGPPPVPSRPVLTDIGDPDLPLASVDADEREHGPAGTLTALYAAGVPLSNHGRAHVVIARALEHYSPDLVRAGVLRLVAERRTCSEDALRIAIHAGDPPPAGQAAPRRRTASEKAAGWLTVGLDQPDDPGPQLRAITGGAP